MSHFGDGAEPAPFNSAHVVTADNGRQMLGCAGAILPIMLFLLVLALSSGSLFFAWIAFVLTAVTVAAVVWAAIEMRRWGPLEIHFPTWPLELGSTTTVRLAREAKRPVPPSTLEFSVAVECEEWVSYTVGTDTRTDTRSVYERKTTETGQLAANAFSASIDIHVPANAGAPTFSLPDNKVKWELEVDISTMSRMSQSLKHEFIVAPVLDTGLRRIQDAQRADT